VAEVATEMYISSNGDRWTLIRDTVAGRAAVRHQPNPSSGGQASDTDAEVFLRQAGSGPEYAALRRLLSEDDETEAAS
jgi:hypothetical protein